ncbi:hypothetical protein FGO68_gene8499 [Halteria grandinella]|uniref:Aminotransferase class V domain-containing protein n=1 Tax=Halteria grandinella TaxID=5974 RepID=A0A8J8SW02_HALGN|nr:hypothetical protein FGO68_gene8499 [Halteria grandinella]
MRVSREAIGTYLHAKPENICFMTNATYAVNVIAHSLGKYYLEEGDEIVTTDQEYGACKRAWDEHAMARGVKWVEAVMPIPCVRETEMLERLWEKVTRRTKIIFVSHISSPTAIRFPVEEMCKRAREQGIMTFIDGAHAPAQIDLNLETLGADFYTGNFHKWMCTPKGSAFLWVSDKFLKKITPLWVSWGSWIPTLKDSYFLDENEFLGTRDYSPFLTLPFALNWLTTNNWPLLQLRNRALQLRTTLKLIETIPGIRSMQKDGKPDGQLFMGVVLLPAGTNTEGMKAWLYDQRQVEVVVHKWLGHPIMRFSVHAHVSEADCDRLVQTVKEYFTTKHILERPKL